MVVTCGKTIKAGRKVGVLILLLWAGFTLPSSVWGQVSSFLTLKSGSQNTGLPAPGVGTADEYLEEIEKSHGSLEDDRLVVPTAIAYDFFLPQGGGASGFSLELNRYTKAYHFEDDSNVQLNVQGLLYGFSFYINGDFLLPYFSLGSGGYNVKIREKLVNSDGNPSKTTASYLDSAPSVFYYELGSRFSLGDWGFLIAWRATASKIKVRTLGKRLELGGQSALLGIYYAF